MSIKYERGRDKFLKYKWLINLLSAFIKIFPLKLRKKYLL